MLRLAIVTFIFLALSACGGGGGQATPIAAETPNPQPQPEPEPPVTYAVGGTVMGLRGTGLVLSNSNGDRITIDQNGAFEFPTELETDAVYEVAVQSPPAGSPAETCQVSGGTGTIADSPVDSIAVSCRTLAGRFAYTINAGSNDISGYSIDPVSGALTPLAGSPFESVGETPVLAFLDPSESFLYVVGSDDFDNGSTLSGYSIDTTTGALAPIPGLPISYPVIARRPVFDPIRGRMFMVGAARSVLSSAPRDDQVLHVYQLDSVSGALSDLPGSPYPLPGDRLTREAVLGGADYEYVYIPMAGQAGGNGNGLIERFLVDSVDGSLSSLAAFETVGQNANELIMHPDRDAMLLRTNAPEVVSYSLDPSSGDLTPRTTVDGARGVRAVFAAGGSHVYLSDANTTLMPAPPPELVVIVPGPGEVFGYSVDAAANLTPLPGSPYPAGGDSSESIAIDPTETLISVTNPDSGTVSTFFREADGSLAAVNGSPMLPAVGMEPGDVLFDRSGRFVFLTDASTNSISSYRIDSPNTAPEFIDSVSTGDAPLAAVLVVGSQ